MSIQKRTSPVKFDHLVDTSEKGSISNLSTKVGSRRPTRREARARGVARHPPEPTKHPRVGAATRSEIHPTMNRRTQTSLRWNEWKVIEGGP